MMYSVWDHADRSYKYYRTPDNDAATSSPKPAHLKATALGLSPEQAAWPLPFNARPVGKGKYPKGFIASKQSRAALGIIPDSPTQIVLYGALAFLAYRYLKDRR